MKLTQIVVGMLLALIPACCVAEVLELAARNTLTGVEMDPGDLLHFTLKNGQQRTLEVESTNARVVMTNLPEMGKGFNSGQTLYEMSCRVKIDGHVMTMHRYVPAQQSFYVPYVVNGMRIWFDAVRDINRMFNDNHGGGVPRKAARFAVQDMTLPIAPEPIRPWYPNGDNSIDVAECYNANDVWLGPYYGADLHGGLDINMPIGTQLWAPIDIDTQFYFNSLKAGDNNNRWRGIRTWDNGDRWTLQTHHITIPLVPENVSVKQSTPYAEAAGVLTGSHAHTHFVFKIGPEGDETLLDPWIVFWQIFEDNRQRAGEIRAEIAPLSPTQVGKATRLDGSTSQAGLTGNQLRFRWTFGDGGASMDERPEHVFLTPGIYPVTLTIDDGVSKAHVTQHITVDPSDSQNDQPALVLESADAIAFARRPVSAMDLYGKPPQLEPMTLVFKARLGSSPRPMPQLVKCHNAGDGDLPTPEVKLILREWRKWLEVKQVGQALEVVVNASQLPDKHGIYRAEVVVDCPGALNSPQSFGVKLEVVEPSNKPASSVTIDNNDDGCFQSPWFWLAPQFHQHFPSVWKSGHGDDYLIYGTHSPSDGFVRFTPDLEEGSYKVSLSSDTPFQPTDQMPKDTRFAVIVRHRKGTDKIIMEPTKSLDIGDFEFEEGMAGSVEIHAANASGTVIADAIHFEKE